MRALATERPARHVVGVISDAVDRAVAAVLADPRSEQADLVDRPPTTGRRPRRAAGRIVQPETDTTATPAELIVDRYRVRPGVGGIADLLDQLARGERTPADLLRVARSRAARWPAILVDLTEAAALRERYAAASSGRDRPGTGRRGPAHPALAGIPIAVKDNIDIEGLSSGLGGPVARHRASADAAATSALRKAGAVPIGHSRMRELAWGVTTPGCPNPWRPGVSTGGSSGGSAAAVAAGIVPAALGTDTGGSIRIPAALCGVTGLRPTHGVAPMDGIAGLSPDLDTVGPLALSAADCLLVHELVAGPGEDAPQSATGLTIGVLQGWQGRVHPAVQDAVDSAARALESAGARLVRVDLGSAGLAASLAYVLMLIDSARLYLTEAERQARAVDTEVLEQLRQGARIDRDPAVNRRAQALAAAIRLDVEKTLEENQMVGVLAPVTAVPAVPADAESVAAGSRRLPVADALSRYTALASVAGLPALSIPAALHDGLPVGIQLLGRRRGERTLALLAEVIEAGPGAEVARARRELWRESET